MAGALLQPDDVIDVVVRSVTPFGLLVETDSGAPGLVGAVDGAAGAETGTSLRVRVTEYDAVKARFSAMLVE
jgi:hypothetical protein